MTFSSHPSGAQSDAWYLNKLNESDVKKRCVWNIANLEDTFRPVNLLTERSNDELPTTRLLETKSGLSPPNQGSGYTGRFLK